MQLVWDVTCPDTLAQSYLHQTSKEAGNDEFSVPTTLALNKAKDLSFSPTKLTTDLNHGKSYAPNLGTPRKFSTSFARARPACLLAARATVSSVAWLKPWPIDDLEAD